MKQSVVLATTEKAIALPNPGINWTWIINLLIAVMGPLLRLVTDSLREELEDWLKAFYVKARETPNPWDDFLADVLCRALKIDISDLR